MAKKVFSPRAGVMQMSIDRRDSSVTTCTLTVTDFNLFSSAIQEDTNQFELKERFGKVRNLL